MNMFARFDENPAMTLQDIKETKHYGRTDGRTDVKTVYPSQTKFAGGINMFSFSFLCNFSEFLWWAIKATNMLQLYTANFLYVF